MAKRRQSFVDEMAGEELILPVTPKGYQWDTGIRVNVVTVDGLGDLHFPGKAALATESVECFFPARDYPFNEPGAKPEPFFYVEWLEKRCLARTILRYIVSDTPINKAVILESVRWYENDGTHDVKAKITFRQYEAPQALAQNLRSEGSGRGEARSHVISVGDTLWTLCLKYYGQTSMALCQRVADYNGIKNVYLIQPGDTVLFPAFVNLPLSSIASSPSQEAALSTDIADDEDWNLTMVTEPYFVAVTLSMTGPAQHYGTATLLFTEEGKDWERSLTASADRKMVTASVPQGSKITVRWSGGKKGKSDFRTVNGVTETAEQCVYWPVADTLIEVHWAKGG